MAALSGLGADTELFAYLAITSRYMFSTSKHMVVDKH